MVLTQLAGPGHRVDARKWGGGSIVGLMSTLIRCAGVHPCSRRPSSSQTSLLSIPHPVRQHTPVAVTAGLHSAAPCNWHFARASANVTSRVCQCAPFGTLWSSDGMWARQCVRAQTDVHRPALQHRTAPPVVDMELAPRAYPRAPTHSDDGPRSLQIAIAAEHGKFGMLIHRTVGKRCAERRR